eukprot:361961-Chlamydomonas_euryale.AAC.6
MGRCCTQHMDGQREGGTLTIFKLWGSLVHTAHGQRVGGTLTLFLNCGVVGAHSIWTDKGKEEPSHSFW